MSIKQLIGKTLKSVVISNDKTEIIFTTVDSEIFKMYHKQDCCEDVYVEDICGDLEDLCDPHFSPILQAESSSNWEEDNEEVSIKYTFYKIATLRGNVTIRWYGSTGSCYAVDVNFEKVDEEPEIPYNDYKKTVQKKGTKIQLDLIDIQLDLTDILQINRDLVCNTTLPENLSIKGNLDLSDTPVITSLPENLKVGNLDLNKLKK